ncbi:EscU/YscU/HrcU family type III secretion system export apparatus switch protein [uncultured Pseudokineococcus sp.]|uniref:EscU/YscU/HrcU family type III secretion system export apparatus switch protein n=1 Tax=uncultured Pseudokineococcus sp. TaxID=1642928 RepID=UPI0026393E86|nr:EscU/YscU/HrcU family type III secretion system export apparatus switch protein [uncultured Pseudokineococcus sp.]
MAGGDSGEKTEQPTEKRLKEARKEGRVARSPDVGAWLGMAAAGALLPMTVTRGWEAAQTSLQHVRDVAATPDPELAVAALSEGLRSIALVMAPLAAVTVVVAIGAAAAQGGLHPATKNFKPQFSKLSPKQGLTRILGPQAWWEACKILLKTAALGVVLWLAVKGLTPVLVGAGSLPLGATVDAVGGGTATLIRTAVVAGLALAIADYLVVRKRTLKGVRMTRKEVMDEHKQSEGDPQLKGAIRSKQLAMSRNRMMAEIATADVVLLNPTHVAVALRYEPGKGAPRVVAKGAGAVAAKIRERAAEHRVPMVEDVPLARALHGACALGQEVPAELFTAVAHVLAFVMRLRSRGAAAGRHRMPAVPAGV